METPEKGPLRATRLGPTEAEQVAELTALATHACQLGVLLEGHWDPSGKGYRVAARRADTRRRLGLSFPVTAGMSRDHAAYMAALRDLLAKARALLAAPDAAGA